MDIDEAIAEQAEEIQKAAKLGLESAAASITQDILDGIEDDVTEEIVRIMRDNIKGQ